jgi:hypothetical protein
LDVLSEWGELAVIQIAARLARSVFHKSPCLVLGNMLLGAVPRKQLVAMLWQILTVAWFGAKTHPADSFEMAVPSALDDKADKRNFRRADECSAKEDKLGKM